MLHVRPKTGNIFLQPENFFKPMPLTGVMVEATPYYIKALAVGDLVAVVAAPATQPALPIAFLAASTTIAP